MDFLTNLPVWTIALLIFLIRIVDVSIGTLRTISLVQGRITLAFFLGFFEASVWITALSQVIGGVSENPFLILAYAGGFATGNAVGLMIDRRVALGHVVVRMISSNHGNEIASILRSEGLRATTFYGEGRDGPVVLVYVTCSRRKLSQLIKLAKDISPEIFYTVEPVHQQSEIYAGTLPPPTGWRAVFKMK